MRSRFFFFNFLSIHLRAFYRNCFFILLLLLLFVDSDSILLSMNSAILHTYVCELLFFQCTLNAPERYIIVVLARLAATATATAIPLYDDNNDDDD